MERLTIKRLSIIIPHYNSVSTLEKLLYSIPLKNEIETIVVDDKSKETELEKLVNLLEKKFKHVLFFKNNTDRNGAGVCRNIGLNNASGDWILFADSDDYFIDNFYEKITKYFETDSEVVFFKPTSIEVDTGSVSNRHLKYERLIEGYLDNQNHTSELYLRYLFFVPWSKLVKRTFLKKYNIKFEEIIASNDIMFSTKVGYYLKKFDVSTDVIYCVTRSSGTLTTQTSEEVYDIRLMAFVRYWNFLKNNLNNREFKTLNLSGGDMLVKAYQYKLGYKKIVEVYNLFRKNRIRVFQYRLFNPFFIIKKFIKYYKNHKKLKKYIF